MLNRLEGSAVRLLRAPPAPLPCPLPRRTVGEGVSPDSVARPVCRSRFHRVRTCASASVRIGYRNRAMSLTYDQRSEIRMAFDEAYVPPERRRAARVKHQVDAE